MTTNSDKHIERKQGFRTIQNFLNKIKNKSQRIIRKTYNSLSSPYKKFLIIFLIINIHFFFSFILFGFITSLLIISMITPIIKIDIFV